MKARHLQLESDSRLLRKIQKAVRNELKLNKSSVKWALVFKFIFYLGLSTMLYTLIYTTQNPVLFVLNYVLLGLGLLLLAFNFAHDLSHNTIFKKKKWNNLGFIALYTLVGAHAEAWRERHVNSHHFAPNVKEYDTDLQITQLIRVTPDMPYRWYHKFQFVYAPLAYSTYSLYWIFIKDFTILRQYIKEGKVGTKYILSFLAQKIFYLLYMLLLPLLFAPQHIGLILFGFLLMHLVQSVFLLFTFFMTHHVMETTYPATDSNGVIQTSWLMNQIGSSNDMHPFSKPANFILGGFNNHIAHHLFPQINHIHYPSLNRVLYRILGEHGISPNRTSYLGGVVSHLKLLWILGRG